MVSSLLISIFLVFGTGIFISWSFPHKWDFESRAALVLATIVLSLLVLVIQFPNPSNVTWF